MQAVGRAKQRPVGEFPGGVQRPGDGIPRLHGHGRRGGGRGGGPGAVGVGGVLGVVRRRAKQQRLLAGVGQPIVVLQIVPFAGGEILQAFSGGDGRGGFESGQPRVGLVVDRGDGFDAFIRILRLQTFGTAEVEAVGGQAALDAGLVGIAQKVLAAEGRTEVAGLEGPGIVGLPADEGIRQFDGVGAGILLEFDGVEEILVRRAAKFQFGAGQGEAVDRLGVVGRSAAKVVGGVAVGLSVPHIARLDQAADVEQEGVVLCLDEQLALVVETGGDEIGIGVGFLDQAAHRVGLLGGQFVAAVGVAQQGAELGDFVGRELPGGRGVGGEGKRGEEEGRDQSESGDGFHRSGEGSGGKKERRPVGAKREGEVLRPRIQGGRQGGMGVLGGRGNEESKLSISLGDGA